MSHIRPPGGVDVLIRDVPQQPDEPHPFLTHAAHGLPDSKVHISHSAISAMNEAYSSESLDADLRRGLRAAAHHLRPSLEPRRLAAEALRATTA